MQSATPGHGLTAQLIERALRVRYEDLPADVRRVAGDCLADWLACTFAGLDEPASRLVAAFVNVVAATLASACL